MGDNNEVRGRVLQTIWRQIRALDESNVRNYPAARRAIASGAAPDDVVRAMRHASYEMAFGMLHAVTSEHAEEGNYDATTGWALVEADLLDSGDAVPNGSESLEGLHEDLLTSDPTGSEAQDFLA